MANHRSAEKRIRQTEKRTLRNRSQTSRIKTYTRKVEEALAAGDGARAQEALRAAEPHIRKGVAKGVLHLNTASRKISRLALKVNALQSQA